MRIGLKLSFFPQPKKKKKRKKKEGSKEIHWGKNVYECSEIEKWELFGESSQCTSHATPLLPTSFRDWKQKNFFFALSQVRILTHIGSVLRDLEDSDTGDFSVKGCAIRTTYNHRVKVDMMSITCPPTNSKTEYFSWARCGSYGKEPAI